MTKNQLGSGADWVAAAIAPWTISPHPNFSQSQIRPQQAVALVSEFRFYRERERYEVEYPEDEPWARDLVNAILQSVTVDTQRQGGSDLWALAENAALPIGARTAAALYAATASAELDEADVAAERLGVMVKSLEPIASSASARLAVATLAQQRVLRLFDSSQYGAATEAVRRVMEMAPLAKERRYDDFIVSEGISWSAGRVQADISSTIRALATAARSTLEALGGQTWVQVVRARRGWLEYRARGLAAERDSLLVRDAFESKLESTSQTQHFMRTTARDAGYEALLNAELSGSTGGAMNSREQLGKILMLETELTSKDAVEAIRLLRQARAAKPLQSALTWLRNEGPTSSLVSQSTVIVERALRAGWMTDSDLLVLESASDFLTGEIRERAIRAAFTALSTEVLGRHVDWSTHDKVWRAVGRLVAETSSQSFVAARALEYLASPQLLVEPLTSRLADVLGDLDWKAVAPDVADTWREWAEGAAVSPSVPPSREDDIRVLRDSVLRHASDSAEVVPEEIGMHQAAFLADNGVPEGESGVDLNAVSEYLIGSLRDEASRAHEGAYSFGGYSTAEVAVAYALRFGREDVWRAVVDHLTDEKIDAAMKTSALDRLARFVQRVPVDVRSSIAERFQSLLRSPRTAGFFQSPSGPVFAEAVRLGGAIGALEGDDAVRFVMQLSAGDAQSRVQAAKTLPYVMAMTDATWAHSLLLQLSFDANPVVRAEASAGLVRSLRWTSSLDAQIRERVRDSVTSEGVRVPLFTIQAIRTAIRDQTLDVDFIRSALSAAAANDRPRIVARAAQLALSDEAGPERFTRE